MEPKLGKKKRPNNKKKPVVSVCTHWIHHKASIFLGTMFAGWMENGFCFFIHVSGSLYYIDKINACTADCTSACPKCDF